MVSKVNLEQNLNTIEALFLASATNTLQLFYAKLALLELCGWTEESMDEIVRGCVRRRIRKKDNVARIDKDVIRRTNGFVYNDHFRPMMCRIIGEIGVNKLEQRLDVKKFAPMRAALNNLKDPRNSHAHTYLKGTQIVIDAPSVTKANMNTIFLGLVDIEKKVRKLGF